jgi:ABC-type nitrate/sulfonate/bicarbonate transport system ATPase subunit
MSEPSMQIECRELIFRYPGTDTTVFDRLSFQMAGPGFNALFGPSGVGKTSLARMLIGELQDFQGRLATPGLDRILYTYNLERLPGWSAVGKHLERITPSKQRAVKDELVDLFGMAKLQDVRFSQLSLGQKNRINLIRYLLQDFQMLIMDESLANVDEVTREKIILNIKALFPERFFIYISHNIVEVSKFCREILVLTGPGRRQSALVVSGQDQQKGASPPKEKLEHTMLEIMNAA